MGGAVSGHHCPRVDSEIFRTQERMERQGESEDETFGKCNGESRCTSHTQSAPRRPARASRRPPRPCTPRPLRFPPPAPHPHPATASCAIFPPDLQGRAVQATSWRGIARLRGPDDAWRSLPARCASPRASPAAGRAVQSPARLSHRRISGEEACVVCHSLCSNPRAHAPAASTSRPPAPAPATSLPARRAPSSSPLRPPLCTPLCTPPRSPPEARGRFERESFVY